MATQSSSTFIDVGFKNTPTIVEVLETTRNKNVWCNSNLVKLLDGTIKAHCKHCDKFLKHESNSTLKMHIKKYCEGLKSVPKAVPQAKEPCEAKRKQKRTGKQPVVDLDEDDEDDEMASRRSITRWNNNEEILLAESWIEHSQDANIEKDQHEDIDWNLIMSDFNSRTTAPPHNLQELFGPDPRERPASKQRAKKKQKSIEMTSAGGSTGGSQSESVSSLVSQDYRRKCDAAEKAYEAKREKELAIMQCKELEFLMIDPSLSQDQANELERIVSRDEIRMAVWNCGNNKSPRPDGYNFEFFKKYWGFIGPDFCEAVEHFFVHGAFSKGCNSSFIALIPKVMDAKLVTDFRPISIIGCVYKVVTKIMASRLALVISNIVSNTQVVEVGIFKGIRLNSSLSLSRLFYADDALIIGVGVLRSDIETATSSIGCFIMGNQFRYLGVMVGGNMSRHKAWADVVFKLRSRLSKWKAKTLSIGGRLTLLKSVLGGLGVSSFFALNRALLLKWVWSAIWLKPSCVAFVGGGIWIGRFGLPFLFGIRGSRISSSLLTTRGFWKVYFMLLGGPYGFFGTDFFLTINFLRVR
nr:transposon TX1 putative 149 kDa protein [Tanacetum cinerariifolium]